MLDNGVRVVEGRRTRTTRLSVYSFNTSTGRLLDRLTSKLERQNEWFAAHRPRQTRGTLFSFALQYVQDRTGQDRTDKALCIELAFGDQMGKRCLPWQSLAEWQWERSRDGGEREEGWLEGWKDGRMEALEGGGRSRRQKDMKVRRATEKVL